jgi:hypothetical protein
MATRYETGNTAYNVRQWVPVRNIGDMESEVARDLAAFVINEAIATDNPLWIVRVLRQIVEGGVWGQAELSFATWLACHVVSSGAARVAPGNG